MASVKRPMSRVSSARLTLPTAQPAIYVPPPAIMVPPPPPATIGGDASYESSRVELATWPRGALVPIYTTQRRWKAIDVYVQPSEGNPASGVIGGADDLESGNVLSIYVFAINNGIRTCVATGRRIIYDDANLPPFRAHVASSRVVADRFEVVAHLRQAAAAGDLAGGLLFNVLATDEVAAGAELAVGAEYISSSEIKVGPAAGAALVPPPFEVLRVTGANATTAMRWIHVHDTLVVANAGVNGVQPLIALPLPDETMGAAPTIVDLSGFQFNKAPRIVTSSTATTTTRTTDCLLTALVR